ncbi:SDR family oxidoreductase [bacterium]|nr:MAG: SDR family oxidoreductase [bacterium]
MSKIALISGANRGLGLETARQLGRDHGFTVLLGARDEAKGVAAQDELRGEGLDAHFIALDVTDEDSVAKAARFIGQEYGLLDVLVNNAGIMLEHSFKVGGVDLETWKQTFDVNVFGAVALTNATLPLLEKSDEPRVVNLSAILGSLTEISKPQMKTWIRASYSASKAALNAYTIALAQEKSADPKWKINAAHPGWAKTDMGGPQALMSAAQGVKTVVQLATLGKEGPSGGFFHVSKTINW